MHDQILENGVLWLVSLIVSRDMTIAVLDNLYIRKIK